jgi:hypothetical protein
MNIRQINIAELELKIRKILESKNNRDSVK